MNTITKETRKEAHNIGHKTLEEQAYNELGEDKLTARELAKKMYKKRDIKNRYKTRNCTAFNRIRKTRICKSDRKA